MCWPGRRFFGIYAFTIQGKRYHKIGSLANPATVRIDRSVMKIDQVFNNRQPKSKTTLLAASGTVPLTEAIEYVWEEFRVYSLTCVADDEQCLVLQTLEANLD